MADSHFCRFGKGGKGEEAFPCCQDCQKAVKLDPPTLEEPNLEPSAF